MTARDALRPATLALGGLLLLAGPVPALAADGTPAGPPALTLDLATADGLAAVAGSWRHHEARIVEATYLAPGPDGQPSATPRATFDVAPHAGARDFDDSGWEIVPPGALAARRGGGRVSFAWYRLRFTIPVRVGDVDPTGTTVVFTTSVDDYAEVWVDGELARGLGQQGGSVVGGWNVVNRVVAARNVRPGREVRIAVFAMNGPISNPVTNYVWVRSATLEFHRASREPVALPPAEVNVEVERLDPAIDEIVPRNAKVHKVAEGFEFTEGPVWTPDGRLLFSDPNANRIYEYVPDDRLRVVRERSGYAGADAAEYRQPGSNGLALDPEGRLTVCEHGNRRVSRDEPGGGRTVLADRFDGKRLNSPNDLVWRSDGVLYFSDPPFGLPRFGDDPRRELPFFGVFALVGGVPRVVADDLAGPNGVALSPDERHLYVGNWDERRKVVMRYDVRPDGGVEGGRVLVDLTDAPGGDAIDGIEVDERGNLYVSGPGGVWVIAPDGRKLGTIRTPRLPANFAWGDADGRSLYMTARDRLYRMRLLVSGAHRSPTKG